MVYMPNEEGERIGMRGNVSVHDQVYYILRKNILDLTLEPATSMSTQELADKLKVSRTPVREALIRLQKDGLVIVLPQRETIVSRINLKRVKQEHSMRRRLETSVLETFMLQKKEEQLAQMEEMIEKQRGICGDNQYGQMLEYDDSFHSMLFQFAGEAFIWDVLKQISTHYYRVRLLNLKVDGVPPELIHQHQELLDTMRRGTLADVRPLLDAHLNRVEQEIIGLRQTFPNFFEDREAPPGNVFEYGLFD